YLLDLLNECGGRVRDAAERAQINHVTLYRLMRKHGLVLDRAARARG
ncbi:MAG: hypothetical protein JNL79_05420, partial [Myxococcales bacterium]|nr:hypothetical protein [Myxococcales bacterium]